MTWDVRFTAKADKQAKALPESIRERLMALIQTLRLTGPVQVGMPNYGKLKGQTDTHHCHLKKGKPTYVAVWQAFKKLKQVVLTYVGTHENAPY
jgi:mRNA-degrading endonuclease RelE of RelBE toxin-antitoxin system